jgi:hypothetical protein
LYAEAVGDRGGSKTASVPAEAVSKAVCRVAWNELVQAEATCVGTEPGKSDVKVSVVEVRPSMACAVLLYLCRTCVGLCRSVPVRARLTRGRCM